MVWALQGAGRVFKEQEEVKRAEMINGLRYELHSISETSEKIIDEMKVNRRLRLISMKKILAQPPFGLNEMAIRNISDLYEMCRKINEHYEEDVDEKIKKELKNVLELSSRVEEDIKK